MIIESIAQKVRVGLSNFFEKEREKEIPEIFGMVINSTISGNLLITPENPPEDLTEGVKLYSEILKIVEETEINSIIFKGKEFTIYLGVTFGVFQ